MQAGLGVGVGREVDEVVVAFITADAMLASTLASILWDEESELVGVDDDKVSVSVPMSLTALVGVGEIDCEVVPDKDALISVNIDGVVSDCSTLDVITLVGTTVSGDTAGVSLAEESIGVSDDESISLVGEDDICISMVSEISGKV